MAKNNELSKGKPDETKVNLVPISMTHKDWESLHSISAAADQLDSSDQLWRFENHSKSLNSLTSDFLVAYWFGESYSNLLLAKSYLDALGVAWIALWDMAEMNDDGDLMGYVLITDYNNEEYRH